MAEQHKPMSDEERKVWTEESMDASFVEILQQARIVPKTDLPNLDDFLRRARAEQERAISAFKNNLESIDAIRKVISQRMARPGP